MIRIGAYLTSAALAAASGAALARPADPGTEAQREAGKAIYMEKCSQCHGENGDAKGEGADFFKPLPRDFTSGAYKIRTTGSGELPTDADLKAIIRRGMPHTGMPAWPKFSDAELASLAYFIKTFNPDFADSANLTDPIEVKKAPAFSAASAGRGRAVFEENKCMDCHGRLGRGDGESAPTLEDDWGHRIRPADLTKRWTFRGGPAREDIYRTFMTGLNGTPMPSYASSIEKEEDRWALVDYVHSLSAADKAPYASVVVAEKSPVPLDLEKGRELFKDARPALFPVVGQVIEGSRAFFPAADAVEVSALYDSANVAFLLTWHDMSAEKTGTNSPKDAPGDGAGPAPSGSGMPGPAVPGDAGETGAQGGEGDGPRFSDAVALQLPLHPADGAAKPYFLFGDPRHPTEIWFQDLAREAGERFVGKGNGNLVSDGAFRTRSGYADGEWWVAFLRPRQDTGRLALEPGAFVPIAFSVWDGFGAETGSRRGVTSWYNLYLKPAAAGSPVTPAGKTAAGILLCEVLAVWYIRRRLRAKS